MDIVLVSGGFDPLHSGHIDYFREAKKLGDRLVVGINSDAWLTRKKGKSFMSEQERTSIISSLEMVDAVYTMDDSDDTATNFIASMMLDYPDYNLIFANGGDRTQKTVPEFYRFHYPKLKFVFGVGGDKTQSSSELLKQYKTTKRMWGHFTELFKDSKVKVKELVIDPGKGISYQKHFLRSEMWFISQGKCTVKTSMGERTNFTMHNLREDDVHVVRANEWHQLYNPYSNPCHVIEIQYGEETSEEDILRDEA